MSRDSLPASYGVWLAGAVISLLGNGALYFALGWTASAEGGRVAALVLTAVNLPRALLLLFGGAISDRFGARRVMIAGDVVMLGACVALALILHLLGTPAWLLVVAGLVVGVVDAFYLPASGSMPRRLVAVEQLPRAMALRQAGGQVVSLVGAPLGSLLVVATGLVGVLLVDALTFGLVLITLVLIRPMVDVPVAAGGGLLRAAVDGVRVSARHPVLRPALLLTGAFAGFVLPVISLLVPLLARQHAWGARTAGLVVGAHAVGTILVALLVARRGRFGQLGPVSVVGLAVTVAGILVLGLAGGAALAVVGAAVAGAGSGTFVAHIGPLVLAATPDSHLSRVQALLALVQSVTLLVTNNIIGAVSDAAGPVAGCLLCAAVLGTAGALCVLSAPFRRAENGAAAATG